jgi:YbgC/YbaW family acyl-CoA thioester hydrolase
VGATALVPTRRTRAAGAAARQNGTVNLVFRVIWLWLTVGRKPPLDFRDVDRLPMRARWTDLDQLRHVNNGVYLSMMDLGRVDLMKRSGMWKRLMDAAYYPVVAAQTITYRRSLQWRQRFVLETRMAGFHDKALFVEQRFVVDGEIFARAFVKARFLKRSGGTVSVEELNALAGEDLTLIPLEGWIRRGADDVALPSTRAEAPSEWPA